MLKRILVALSGTPYTTSAVRYALELARAHGAEITGVTVADLASIANVGPVPVGAGAAAAELAEHRHAITEDRVEQAVADFYAACSNADIPHRVVREEGDPFGELTSLWRYHDLTVLGLRGLFEYGVIHNASDHLIELMKTGVRPLMAVSQQYRPIRRVIIAYKGSMASAKAMKRFIQMGLWPDLTCKFVCCDGAENDANLLLTDAAEYYRLYGVDAETEHLPGPAKDVLLPHAAEWNADLIVLGAEARSRMARFVLGDITLTAIRNAEIPLYLMR